MGDLSRYDNVFNRCRRTRWLCARQSKRVNERTLRSIAAKRGQPLEQTRSEVAADFERMMAWWAEVQSDPARYEALVQESLDQQQARAVG